jgi:hypothetical protein
VVRGAASESSGDDGVLAGGWRLAGVVSSSRKQSSAAIELYTTAGGLAGQSKTAL